MFANSSCSDSHIQRVPFAQRNIEGPSDVVEATVSDDVRQGWVQDAVKEYWANFLERFASSLVDAVHFSRYPSTQRFIGWLEAALEDPIGKPKTHSSG